MASLRVIEAFECGLPRPVRMLEHIKPQRWEVLVYCPESLSPFGMPLNRVLSECISLVQQEEQWSFAGPCSGPGSLG